MNNLRIYGGRVPLPGSNDNPVKLVDFPSREDFIALWGNRVTAESKDKYFEILSNRAAGKTLSEVGRPYGLSRERVRQIEAKFIRLLHRFHQKKELA
jgi:DNA-directed RNA polymerase sigma subunit (sigma70/sigma32)